MKAILTADIISSQKIDPKRWLEALRLVLSVLGNETTDWEIYRGDSFQLITEPEKALLYAYLIKARIKQFNVLDVRIAIGIGDIMYRDKKITQSNGSAFIYSGKCFDALKKNTLGIKTSQKEFDETLNLILFLMNRFADHWTEKVAEVITVALNHPEENQTQWAARLGKSQSTVNAALKRGGYDELQAILIYYKNKVKNL